MTGRSAFAVTRTLAKAEARYPWAIAWVKVQGGIWCFESEQGAWLYQQEAEATTQTEEVIMTPGFARAMCRAAGA
jgi:hypothetical protein